VNSQETPTLLQKVSKATEYSVNLKTEETMENSRY